MSEYFDSAAWVKMHTDYDAAQQDLQTKKTAEQQEQIKLKMAQRAMAEQIDAEEHIKKIPNIAERMKTDPEGVLAEMAGAGIQAGLVDWGAETLAKSASTAEASAKSAQARTEDNIKTAQFVSSAFNEVTDKASWERAGMRLRSQLANSHSPQLDFLRDLPNKSPNFDYAKAAKEIAGAATNAVDQANIEQSEAATAYQKEIAATEKVRRETLLPAQVKAVEALATQRLGVGQVTTAAGAANLASAKLLLQQEFDIEDPELGIKAREVVENMQPGLSGLDAVKASIQGMKNDRAFAGYKKASVNLGQSADNPKSLPIVDGDIAMDRMVPNLYYTIPAGFGKYSGQVVVWDGKAFVPVQGRGLITKTTRFKPTKKEDR